jgi:hypothetical protein
MTWTASPRPARSSQRNTESTVTVSMRSAKRFSLGWSSKATLAAKSRAPQPLRRREMQRGRLVAFQAKPGLRPLARVRRGVVGHRQRFDRPLVRLLVAARPRVGHHAVGGRVEAGDAAVVGQGRGERRLRLRREHDQRRLVLPEIVEEELAQSLAIERSAAGAALVQLVDHAPGTLLAVPVGEAEVRVAQPVLAQVLAGAGEHDDPGSGLVESRRRLLGERHRPRDRLRRQRPLFAGTTSLGAARPEGQRQAERDEGRPARAAHRVILSL